MISVFLVAFRQLYLTIQVAILVGKFLKDPDTGSEDEIHREIEDLKKEIIFLKKSIKKD